MIVVRYCGPGVTQEITESSLEVGDCSRLWVKLLAAVGTRDGMLCRSLSSAGPDQSGKVGHVVWLSNVVDWSLAPHAVPSV